MVHPSIHPPNEATAQIGPCLLRFSILLFTHAVGHLWTSDQPVAKASTYTGKHNTKTNVHAPSEIRTHDTSNQATDTYALGLEANGIGKDIQLDIIIFTMSTSNDLHIVLGIVLLNNLELGELSAG
jgi:hypothetical protein